MRTGHIPVGDSPHINETTAKERNNCGCGETYYHEPGYFDNVERPAHYAAGREFEPIDVIVDWELGYLDGNVVKYLSRWTRKGDPAENLKKARFYLDRLIAKIEGA